MAAGEGFEPSHTESESAVLPLHKPAISVCRSVVNRSEQILLYRKEENIIPENKNLSRFFLKKIIFVDFSRFQGIFPGKPPLRVHHQKQISLFRK